jgi:hypothetical protein
MNGIFPASWCWASKTAFSCTYPRFWQLIFSTHLRLKTEPETHTERFSGLELKPQTQAVSPFSWTSELNLETTSKPTLRTSKFSLQPQLLKPDLNFCYTVLIPWNQCHQRRLVPNPPLSGRKSPRQVLYCHMFRHYLRLSNGGQTTHMNLGQAHYLPLQTPTLDFWLEITRK